MNESSHDSTAPPENGPFATVASLNQLIGRPGPPPLRIHHILAATTVAAVLLSVNQVLRYHDTLHLSAFMGSAWGASYAVGTAISITLVGFGLYWRRRGLAFFDLPGHWLLVFQSLGLGFFLMIAASELIYSSTGSEYSSLPMGIYFLLVNFAQLVIGIGVAWKIADSALWRTMFLFIAFQTIAVIALSMLVPRAMAFISFLPFVAFAIQAAAAIDDRRARRPRDWPHWLAVFLHLGMYLVAIGQQLGAWFGYAVMQ